MEEIIVEPEREFIAFGKLLRVDFRTIPHKAEIELDKNTDLQGLQQFLIREGLSCVEVESKLTVRVKVIKK